MPTATYQHGVTWRDVPTSIVAPVEADSGIPVAVGLAPSYLASSAAPPNKTRIYYTYEEAVAEMGFSYDFKTYGLCEVIYTYFVLFNTGPIILSNILDLDTDTGTPVANQSVTFVNGKVDTGFDSVIMSTVVVKDSAGTITYVKDTDYVATFSNEGTLVLTVVPTGSAILPNANVKVSYTPADVSGITKQDIIGGVDATTGMGTGLEVLEDVFPTLSIVPGCILCPGYSQDPEVFAVMTSKGENINNCFKCIAIADVDSTTVIKAMDVYDWKNTNNYVSNRGIVCFPRVGIDEKQIWMSTQEGALIELTDWKNGGVPVETPSNKNFKMNRTVVGPLDTPTDYIFGKGYADMLNGQGICTAINWIGGWKCWGNNNSIYPSSSDVKDRWIPVRRMTDWLGNTLVLTCYQFVDDPGNRRLIESIVDSINIWLNSLVSSGYSLGARIEFKQNENSDADLMSGHYTFHVYEAFPTPAEWIEFLIEFDVSYLSNLFTPITTASPLLATTAA